LAKLSLAVLFGGRSGEHEISLRSARSVLNALDRNRYEVIEIGITHQGAWLGGENVLAAFEAGDVSSLQPVALFPEPGQRGLYVRGRDGSLALQAELDVAFPALHGSFGEDGTLQGFFELAELPYVGAGVLASAVAMDKALFKQLMRAHRILVPEFVVLESVELEADMQGALDRAEAVAPYPLFVKPANLGSSVGISKVRSRSDLLEGLMDAAQYDRRLVVERAVPAREIEVSVLGNEQPEASMPGEIVPSDEFYSYRAKYIDETSELHIPAPIDPETAEEARRIAAAAYRAIDCAGMARVDLLLDKLNGKLYMNEINTIPGFTSISMYPKLWEASGVSYSDLMDRLIELALARGRQTHGLSRKFKGAGG